MDHSFFFFFLLKVPDYYDIIKKPIALNIIREKVNKCEYKYACKYYLLKEVKNHVLSKINSCPKISCVRGLEG